MNFHTLDVSESFKEQISGSFDSGKFPHAVIIEGGSSSLRKETAKFIAKALVCISDEEKPCGVCSQCHKAGKDSHSDIIKVIGTSKTGKMTVEDIRSMREIAFVAPNEAQRKVYIIYESGDMSEQTQNMLLKVLEEPPHYVCIILECEDKSFLLETVRSRSTVFRLSQEEDDSLSKKKKEKAYLLAEEMANAMLSERESDLMAVIGSFEKNYDLLTSSLRRLVLIIRDAIILPGDVEMLGGCVECSNKLKENFSPIQLMKVIDNIEDILDSVQHSGNKNLILTRCCYLIRRSVGR